MSIDIDYARKKFQEYLDSYDKTDDKIHLKAVHTFCVVDAADEICKEEKFCLEDHKLALLIALLHDIGRFEQLKRFNSFDDKRFNHADFGVNVLFDHRMIEQFISDRQYDEIIKKAIQYHSVFSLDSAGNLSPKERLHAQIIRDADKLDNFRVKDTEKIETLFDTPEEIVAGEEITPVILETVRRHSCVLSRDRVTHMDCWVSYLAFIFDLNFSASFRWILHRDYMNRNIDKISYKNPKTKENMEEIREICNAYLNLHAANFP